MPTELPRDIHRIAISTSGGDAPGLNAVIRGVTKAAILKADASLEAVFKALEEARAKGKGKGKGDKGGKKPEGDKGGKKPEAK